MGDKARGAGMTLKKKMARMEFRKQADNILMRLTLEVEPFWQDRAGKQAERLRRAARIYWKLKLKGKTAAETGRELGFTKGTVCYVIRGELVNEKIRAAVGAALGLADEKVWGRSPGFKPGAQAAGSPGFKPGPPEKGAGDAVR
jgi:hypothetical protein